MKLPIELHKTNGIPIYVQLSEQIRLLVHQGTLKQGDPMPTVRELAIQLEINANTVARVYRQLQSDGVLSLRRGLGTFVSETKQSKPHRDLRKVEKKADELIALSRDLELSAVELFQLLEMRWKEADDAHR